MFPIIKTTRRPTLDDLFLTLVYSQDAESVNSPEKSYSSEIQLCFQSAWEKYNVSTAKPGISGPFPRKLIFDIQNLEYYEEIDFTKVSQCKICHLFLS